MQGARLNCRGFCGPVILWGYKGEARNAEITGDHTSILTRKRPITLTRSDGKKVATLRTTCPFMENGLHRHNYCSASRPSSNFEAFLMALV
jgi:hypothetical protein